MPSVPRDFQEHLCKIYCKSFANFSVADPDPHLKKPPGSGDPDPGGNTELEDQN